MFYKSFDKADMKKQQLLDKEQECLSCKIDLYETMLKNQQAKLDEFVSIANNCPPTAPQELKELCVSLTTFTLFMRTNLEKASANRDDTNIAIRDLQETEGYLDQLKNFNLIGILFDHAYEDLERNQKVISEAQEIANQITAALSPSEDEPKR